MLSDDAWKKSLQAYKNNENILIYYYNITFILKYKYCVL